IPAKGHTVGEWEILENSTCSREGTRVKRCSDCGTVTKSEAIPRSGHEKGNWIITETPTEGSYGVKARFCIGCGMKMEEKIIYSVSNVVVKDDATGIEVVYPDGTFTGTMTVSTRNLPGSEIGSKVYAKLGECNFKGYEVKFYENGIQVNPSNTYSVRIPVPYSFNKNSAEVYGISMTTGELYKVNASYENGYFLIENADTIQYVITEKIITVSLSQTHLDMKKGDTVQLYAYTNGQGVTFTSSNPSVVTVDFYGNITAVGNGSAVITATVNGTTVQEECTVEVTQSFFDMIITAITEAFSEFFKFFTDIFKSINGSLS
ncbi:MAG: Ig-like domain-containing protein, partial [Clostridia bacterium]|nr:Ig-like domain-containing protein [Clostridia bacterium]